MMVPCKARWLTEDEKQLLERRLDDEARAKRLEAPDTTRLLMHFGAPRSGFERNLLRHGDGELRHQLLVAADCEVNALTVSAHHRLFDCYSWALAESPWLRSDIIRIRQESDGGTLPSPASYVRLAFAASTIPGARGRLRFRCDNGSHRQHCSSYSTFWALPTTLLSGTAASADRMDQLGWQSGWICQPIPRG